MSSLLLSLLPVFLFFGVLYLFKTFINSGGPTESRTVASLPDLRQVYEYEHHDALLKKAIKHAKNVPTEIKDRWR